MTTVAINENLARRLVRAIDKAVADDIPQYLRDNHLETHNAIVHLRGDYINENLRRLVVSEGVELISFKRFVWSGRILVDKREKITYTITTQANLHAIPRKKGREKPHFLQSILAIENGGYDGHMEQLAMFPMELFESDILQNDYNDIIAGMLNPAEGYRHYVIAYKSEQDALQDVKLEFLDRNFNVIDRVSLNEYIQPDFARLTATVTTEDVAVDVQTEVTHDLVALKAGIRPSLKVVEEEA